MVESNDRQPVSADRADGQIAREAAALGAEGISRSTGTGSAGSGVAASGNDTGTSYHATTGATTNESDDLADAAGPSGVRFGGTGTSGSGLGTPSTTATGTGSEGGGASGGA
jgi:hypothetical protein